MYLQCEYVMTATLFQEEINRLLAYLINYKNV